MAFRELLDKPCAGTAEVFCAIRDFLSGPGGPGWTVVRSSYASGDPASPAARDWCLLRSMGEAGEYPLYLWLTYRTATRLRISAYLLSSGEPPSVAGVGADSPYNNIACPETPPSLLVSISADLDEVHYIVRYEGGAVHMWACCGRVKRGNLLYDGAVARYSGAIPAGADTAVRLLSWPSWAAVGKKVYCWDEAGLDELTIIAADAANRVVTFAETRARSAGGWMAEDVCVFAAGAADWNPDNNRAVYAVPSHAATGVDAAAQVALITPIVLAQQAEPRYGGRLSADMYLCGVDDGQVRGRLALARHSNIAPETQGELWVDPEGEVWRAYLCNASQKTILLRGTP